MIYTKTLKKQADSGNLPANPDSLKVNAAIYFTYSEGNSGQARIKRLQTQDTVIEGIIVDACGHLIQFTDGHRIEMIPEFTGHYRLPMILTS